jgi:hypothetical protein
VASHKLPIVGRAIDKLEVLYHFNHSAGPVTHDRPAEILVLATSQSCHDMLKFLGNFRQFSTTGNKKILYQSHDC